MRTRGSELRQQLHHQYQQGNAITRERAQGAYCPRCKASPGEACQGRRGDRASPHQERYEVILQLHGGRS